MCADDARARGASRRGRFAGRAATGVLLLLTASACVGLPLDGLIFFPDRDVPAPPPGVEELWITADDGVRVHAWWAPADGAAGAGGAAAGTAGATIGGTPAAAAPVLVWSHGNGGNIAGREDVLLALQAAGVSVLAYDYRGYGRSEGRPSETGVYLDARAAYDRLRADGIAPARIVCFGESLGSAVATQLATERPCAGLVLVSPFTTLADVARRHYGPLGALAGARFDALARIAALRLPTFVAHGDRDEVVPFELGERLFAAAPGPKRFFRAAGAHHNDVFAAPGLIDAIAHFAREVTTG